MVHDLSGVKFVIVCYEIKGEIFVHGGPDAETVVKDIPLFIAKNVHSISRVEDVIGITSTLRYLSMDELTQMSAEADESDSPIGFFEFMIGIVCGRPPTETSFLGKVKTTSKVA